MGKKLDIHRLSIPEATFNAMPAEKQSALLLLGMLLNDVNWLRKLLFEARSGLDNGLDDDGPEADPAAGLILLLATTLAGKIHEGVKRMGDVDIRGVIDALPQPDKFKAHRDELDARMSSSKMFVRLRNNLAFHYPEKPVQFKKLKPRLGGKDSALCVTSDGAYGNAYSRLSMLANLELIVATDPSSDDVGVLARIWDELIDVSGLYSRVIFDLIIELIFDQPPQVLRSPQALAISNAPEGGKQPVRFFAHWPAGFGAAPKE